MTASRDGDAVTLRPYEPSDAEALVEAALESVGDVFPWMEWCHDGYGLDQARPWIAAQVEARERGDAFEFVIEDGAGRFLGGCGVNQVNRLHRLANLGYWVRSSAAGRGVASRAARAAAAWAFSRTDLVRLEVVAAVGNARSRRVAEKAGALLEGVARSRLLVHGTPHDAAVYSIVREERVPLSPFTDPLARAHLRVARPSDDLEAVTRFYRDGLGFEVLGGFRDHEGFDGVMLGHPGAPYHLEFTRKAGHAAGRAPTEDNLLVLYLPDRAEWEAAVARLLAAGHPAVPSFNPYWDRLGRTFEDPDGYRVVLQNGAWKP